MEIIAERKKSAAGIFIACIVIGAVCAVGFPVLLGVMYAIGETELDALIAGGIVFLIVGAGFLVTGIVANRRTRRLPQRIIKEGNNIDFDNGIICTADKIENVTYHEYKNSRGMHRFSYGRLTVFVNGEKLVYEFIADVEKAHNRLIQLMLEAAKK